MFGRYPNSGAPFAGATSTLYQKILTIVVTSLATIVSSPVFPKALTVAVTATVSYVRAINKIFSTITDTVSVLITELASHFKTLTVSVTGTTSLVKLIPKLINNVSVTATVALVKLIGLIKTISSTSSITLLKGLIKLKTLSVSVTSTLTLLRTRAVQLFVFISGTPLYNTLSGIVNDAVVNLETINGNISGYANAYYLTLQKQVNKVMSVSETVVVTLARARLAVLTVLSTSTAAIKFGYGKLMTVVEVTVDTLIAIPQHVKLFVISVTSTISLRKTPNKLLFVSVHGIISISRLFQKLLTILVTGFASLLGQVSPIFGAISSNVYYAIQRLRSIDLVKIRTIFLDKNNGK